MPKKRKDPYGIIKDAPEYTMEDFQELRRESVGQRMIDALSTFAEDLENKDSVNTYTTTSVIGNEWHSKQMTAAEIVASCREAMAKAKAIPKPTFTELFYEPVDENHVRVFGTKDGVTSSVVVKKERDNSSEFWFNSRLFGIPCTPGSYVQHLESVRKTAADSLQGEG